MRDFYIWILSIIMVYALGFALADDFGKFLGFYYMVASSIGFGIYRLIKRSHKKEIKIKLGKGTVQIIQSNPEDFKSK